MLENKDPFFFEKDSKKILIPLPEFTLLLIRASDLKDVR